MCGIAGLLTIPLSEPELTNYGTRMAQRLVHRGPDSQGVWCSAPDGVVLAHRRLAIQDLSEHGHQPMHSPSRRYCISFNGEIYNFRELAAELRHLGHSFKGHSDTEVLLAAIEEYGLAKAVKKLSGMFAFGLWDYKERTLHLCRDRLGEKPLYFGWVDGKFLFASELKAIEAIVEHAKLSTSLQSLGQFFKYGYINAPHSIYQGIFKLIPGSIYSPPRFDSPSTDFSPWPDVTKDSPRSYWSLLEVAERGLASRIHDEQEAISGLEKVLSRSVQRQLIADVPAGAFLSGGIDSTIVTALAQKESSTRIKTFTIAFDDPEYDESKYAEQVAKHLGTDHLTIRLDGRDALDVIPSLPSIYDEPFADSSQLPAYLVSKAARAHVTVCLSGDGGDELFGGYNRYASLDRLWRRVGGLPPPIRRLLGSALGLPGPQLCDSVYAAASKLVPGERQRQVGLKLAKLSGLLQAPDQMTAYDFLCSYWNVPEQVVHGATYEDSSNRPPSFPRQLSFLDSAMFWDQATYLPGDNLAKVDRASMAVSLETRLPLLDHDVLEYSWRIPQTAKMKGRDTKWALRQVLYKHVPRELIERPKMGFSVPMAQWLRSDLREWTGDLFAALPNNPTPEFPLVKKTVINAWQAHLRGTEEHSHRLWTSLVYLAWRRSLI